MSKKVELPAAWPSRSIPLSDMDLDPANSRLMLRTRLSDKQLVTRLVEQEEVLDLARRIAQEGGLHPHESIVVVKKGSRYLVLEGNRRTSACRILLDPTLLPETQRGRVPSISDALKIRLKTINAVVAPDVASAAPLVAALHTERGKKPWSAAAKAFHIGRMADAGMTVEAIATSQKLRVGAVRKAILSYRLLEVASSTPGLTKEAKNHLADPRLKLNPFTRFFGLKRAKRLINLGVNDAGKMTHVGLSDAEAKVIIRAIAHDMLLPMDKGGAPRFNTRVHEDTIIGHQIATKPDAAAIFNRREKETQAASPPAKTPEPGKPTIPKAKPVPSPKPQDYFHGLDASGIKNNQALANLVAEVAQFPIGRYPAAGIYLQRGLVEGCLTHAIRTRSLWPDFISKNSQKYGLAALLAYGKDKTNPLWNEHDRMAGLLGKWEGFKFVADQTIHVIMAGNAESARAAAKIIRPLVEGILRGDALKP